MRTDTATLWKLLPAMAIAFSPALSSGAGAGSTIDASEPAEVRHARGTFSVTMRPETETRYDLSKTFSGDMTGTGRATMIGDAVIDAYVALERFEGTVHGRRGGFLLLHRGWVSTADGMHLDIVIAPNSGSGELAGISGSLTILIRGSEHSYDLAYALPGR